MRAVEVEQDALEPCLVVGPAAFVAFSAHSRALAWDGGYTLPQLRSSVYAFGVQLFRL